MKRFGVVVVTALAVLLGAAPGASAAPYTADKAVKVNVMGEWAHPDDDTSIIGPCGVWHQRYDVRCGIIMVTRGEGGGNATGTEIGPELGLRRENEDRVAHYRSGTIDIFNIDSVDFFYNQSAPLTQFFWGSETLRRITRIIRMTQPDIYIGFGPGLNNHGNHQQAGRYIWEGVKAAADPTMFPDQLTGPNALSTWQVKKVFSGGSTTGTGGTTTAADCTTGFLPAATNMDTVAGVWTGYDSPYNWPAGNVQGRPAGTPKIWAQVASEGGSAYPTQSRVMNKGTSNPGCSRFGMTDSVRALPAQRQRGRHGQRQRGQGRRDPLRRGQARPGRIAARHAAVPLVLALLQHAGDAVHGHGQPEGRRRRAGGRQRGADAARELDRRRGLQAGRRDHRRHVEHRPVHGHPAGHRRGRHDVQDRRPLHRGLCDRLHG